MNYHGPVKQLDLPAGWNAPAGLEYDDIRARALPDAQLAVLPGTTHVGVIRRPGEVLALITPFLSAS
jgi:pimeloyl-ACP methyl ester carboxylesterase